MPVSDHDLIQAWQTVLDLCQVSAGNTVTILTDRHSNPQSVAAATSALQARGAIVTRIELQPMNAEKSLSRDPLAYLGSTPLTGNQAAMAACLASDLVLDLMLLLFSPEQQQILQSGTRILLAVEPPEILVRLVPTRDVECRHGCLICPGPVPARPGIRLCR